MASQSQTSFKKYSRDQRIQTSEETFSGGQVFTRAPLASDRARLLVNYDITAEGEALAPRKGYRPSMLGLPFNTVGLQPKITSDISITKAKDAIEEDDSHYRLVIANQFKSTDTPIPNINLYSAPAEMWVVKLDEDNTEYNIPLAEYDIESRNMYALSLSDLAYLAEAYDTTETYNKGDYCLNSSSQLCRCNTDGTTGTWDATKWDQNVTAYKSYYHVPDNPKAHGIALTETKYLARPVGCFAFGNDYYNFNTGGELIRAIYQPEDTELGITATFFSEKLEPKELTAAEATTNGFNMLSETPFVFNDEYQQGNIQLQGIMVYKGTDMITEPVLNTPYTLRCFYTAESSKKYKIKWDYRETNSESYTDIKEEEVEMTGTEPPELTALQFSCPYENAVIRVQAYLYDTESSEYETTPEKTISIGATFVKTPSSITANRELINYDLSKAVGMVYWKNRIWLYGLAQDPTILFASDINEPTYFPYPNNIDIYDEPIITCVPFNDNLLVFTKSQVTQITLSSDGSWTRKILQGNLDFSDFDASMIQTVKNMIFFKSGDYYYMIVPKTLSLQNELAIAPISKNIESFLDDFEDNVISIFKTMYNYGIWETETLTLVNHYNYLDYEDVHNVYTFVLPSGLLVNLVLLYNTIERTWRTYIYESEYMYYPLKQDATKQCELLSPVTIKVNVDGTETTTSGVQFLERSRELIGDFYILNNSVIKYLTSETHHWQADGGVIQTAFENQHMFYNYQMLDTGYRNQSVDLNKRYRELQLKFNNISNMTLHFLTEFILDGDTRVDPYVYEVEQITDTSSSSYGLIYISRTPVENVEVPGGTLLAANSTQVNMWSLDSSRFPEIAFWKARLKVSGKGYTPRFRFTCLSEERYELLGYTWVYRTMYSR